MTLMIWRWGSSNARVLGNAEYPFIAIGQSIPITICITVTFMHYSFYSSLAMPMYGSLISLFLFSLRGPMGWQSPQYNKSSFLLLLLLLLMMMMLIITWSALQIGIKRSVCISKFWRILCVSFSKTDSGLCIYHEGEWSNFSFFLNFPWIPFLTRSCWV